MLIWLQRVRQLDFNKEIFFLPLQYYDLIVTIFLTLSVVWKSEVTVKHWVSEDDSASFFRYDARWTRSKKRRLWQWVMHGRQISIHPSMALQPLLALGLPLIRRLHSSLFAALFLHPLIPSICSASLWTTSAHLVLGLPVKFP